MTGSRTIHLSLLGLAAWVSLAHAAWGQQAYPPAPAITTFPSGGVVGPSAPPPPSPGGNLHDCPGKGCGSPKMCVQEKQETTVPTPCFKVQCKTICTPTCKPMGCGGCCGGGCCRVREVRILMKKFVPVKKCVPVCVPIDAPTCPPIQACSTCPMPCPGGPILPIGPGTLTTPSTPPVLRPLPR